MILMDACVITLDDKSNRSWIFAPLLHLISSCHRSQRSTFKLSVALPHNIDTHISYQSVSLKNGRRKQVDGKVVLAQHKRNQDAPSAAA
jgi:hypothetical protein